MHQQDFESGGFEWIDCHDWEDSTISFIRRGKHSHESILVVCNLTPVVRLGYTLGVPQGGFWREVLNSDSQCYGGSNQGNGGGVDALPFPSHGRDHSLAITLPPLATVFFKSA